MPGRSSTYFEVDAAHIALAALSSPARQGKLDPAVAVAAAEELDLSPDLPPPSECAPCHLPEDMAV